MTPISVGITRTFTKSDLLRIPGRLVMTAAVTTAAQAATIATRDGYVAYFYDKRSQRVYGKLADNAAVLARHNKS